MGLFDKLFGKKPEPVVEAPKTTKEKKPRKPMSEEAKQKKVETLKLAREAKQNKYKSKVETEKKFKEKVETIDNLDEKIKQKINEYSYIYNSESIIDDSDNISIINLYINYNFQRKPYKKWSVKNN